LQIFCRYVGYLSTYLQNICIKVAIVCQNICINIADMSQLSVNISATTQQKIISYWENNSYFKKIFVEMRNYIIFLILIRKTILKMRSIWFARPFFLDYSHTPKLILLLWKTFSYNPFAYTTMTQERHTFLKYPSSNGSPPLWRSWDTRFSSEPCVPMLFDRSQSSTNDSQITNQRQSLIWLISP
jgi:hypothetical protein